MKLFRPSAILRTPTRRDLLVVLRLWLIALLVIVAALALAVPSALALPLSEGDRINVLVDEGSEFSGKYQVGLEGDLVLPYVGAVRIAGAEPAKAAQILAESLVAGRYFRAGAARVSVQVLEWGPVEVTVSGAVNMPGRVRINTPPPRDRAPERTEEAPGARLPERHLSDALRAAGGIRPDADIRRVQLARGGATREFDLLGYFDGTQVEDTPLVSGDVIIVPLTGVEDPRLARPSRLTPPGVRVFVSNLTQPAADNNASTVNMGGLSFAYGSRFSQAVVAANCAGGIRATSAGRKAVLVRTDRLTGEIRKWEGEIEQLLTPQSAEANPILLEGDAVVCYDSTVTNIRDVFRTIFDIVLPIGIWR